MKKCDLCGRSIKFIHRKKDGRKIVVNATSIYFRPSNGYDKEEIFINADGYEVKGYRHNEDGITGYKRHYC